MAVQTTNVFNNVAKITAKALEGVYNNTQMGRRVAARWDGDFKESARIGDTLNIRLPFVARTRTGAVAQPNGYADSYVPVQMAQHGVDVELTSKELTLNVDEFKANVLDNMVKGLVQQFDADGVAATIAGFGSNGTGLGFNQFYGKVGTKITNIEPFLLGRAVMETQGACPLDDKISAMVNSYVGAGMVQGQTVLFNPTDTISENYKRGSLGSFGGLDVFTSANAPSQKLGTWSGTLTVTTTLPTDGGNTLTVAGMTGSFAPGEVFTIAGVHAVNPQGFAPQAELKQFTVVSQVGSLVTFFPPMNLTGINQNIDALPISTAAIYPWGVDAASALAAGTGQTVRNNLVFHEDAIALAIGDLQNPNGSGGKVGQRMIDPKTGLRIRTVMWYDGLNDKTIFRLDALYGWSTLRSGFGARIIE